MTRTYWMAFRLYWPALACLLLAFASTWGYAAHSDPWGDVLRWLPYALLALAMLLAAVASLRLMRWETRISLSRVQFAGANMQGQASIDLEGTVVDTNEPLSLSVPLQLGGSV